MTFLVLLVSIAVLEYLVRRADPLPGARQPDESHRVSRGECAHLETPGESLAEALGQLSRTVDQFGRGAVPDGASEPVAAPRPDAKEVHSTSRSDSP